MGHRHQFNGSAYIFTKNSSGAWIEDFELTASDGATTDSFGRVGGVGRQHSGDRGV